MGNKRLAQLTNHLADRNALAIALLSGSCIDGGLDRWFTRWGSSFGDLRVHPLAAKKRWRNYKWWDSVVITILLLFAFWIISFLLAGPP